MTQKVTTTTDNTNSEAVFYDLIEQIVCGMHFDDALLTVDDKDTGYDGLIVGMDLYDEIPSDVYYDLVFECDARGWDVRCFDFYDDRNPYKYRCYNLADALAMCKGDIDAFERRFCPDAITPVLKCTDGHKIVIMSTGFFDMDMRPYMSRVNFSTDDDWEASLRNFEKEVSQYGNQ